MAVRIHHIAEGWSQHKQRSLAFYYDQHKSATFRTPEGTLLHANGRPYWAWVERPADGAAMPMPVGPISPAGWSAPWYPPDKYLVKSIGRIAADGGWVQGAMSTNYFRIDYGAMVFEDTEATKEYYARVVREAAAQKITPAPKYGAVIPFELEIIVGRAPRSPKIGEAAMAGNDWLLGQRMPEFDAETGTVRVIPDRKLARLIKMATEDLATPDEAEFEAAQADLRPAVTTPQSVIEEMTARMNEQAALIQMLREDMEAARKEREESEARRAEQEKKRGPGRPPKAKPPTPVGV